MSEALQALYQGDEQKARELLPPDDELTVFVAAAFGRTERLGRILDDDSEQVHAFSDDGFTARVIATLPAARREPQWLRAMIVVGLALIGTGMAYFLSGGGSLVRQGVVEMADFPIWLLLVFAFGCGLVVGAFAVIFAIRKTPEVRNLTRLDF